MLLLQIILTSIFIYGGDTITYVPGRVKNLNINSDPFYLTWQTPDQANSSTIEKYECEANIDNNNIPLWKVSTLATRLDIAKPDICTSVTYSVKAIGKDKKAGLESFAFYSEEEIQAPKYINGITEANSLSSIWQAEKPECNVEQFIVKCKPDSRYYNNKTHDSVATVTASDLKPNTNYQCSCMVQYQKTNSLWSEPVDLTTKPTAPNQVKHLEVSNEENTLFIKWDEPDCWNGNKERYIVSISYLGPNYQYRDECKDQFISRTFTVSLDPNSNSYVFSPMEYYSTYTLSIRAKSNGGLSENVQETFTTPQANPDAISSLTLKPNYDHVNVKEYNASVTATMIAACKLNGPLIGYHINLNGQHSSSNDKKKVIRKSYFVRSTRLHLKYKIEKLLPQYTYSVSVALATQQYNSSSRVLSKDFSTKCGVPNGDSSKMARISVTNAPDPHSMAIISIPYDTFSNRMGDIIYYLILISGCRIKTDAQFFKDDDNWTWPKVNNSNNNCTSRKPYQATPDYWNPFAIDKRKITRYFIIGDPNDCNSTNNNRPLDSNSKYWVNIRGFTSNGFRDIEIGYFTTDIIIETQIGLIIGLIAGILGITFIIVALLFYTKGKLVSFTNWHKMKPVSTVSPAPLPVPIKKFDSHYKKMTEHIGKIKSEFQLLSTVSSDVTCTTKTALLPINRKKNRYINILPYDETRVKLPTTNFSESDYINASYINGYNGDVEYIATQGPTEATCSAFWQMIWEQNVKLIVMLTQFIENGKDKCYKYIPDEMDEMELLNNIKIRCVENRSYTIYNYRVFHVEKERVVKKVNHIQFKMWPDFGAPNHVAHIIEFCDIIKQMKCTKVPTTTFTVIHCSAGVGRTGTLIAIDILLQTINDKRKIDIFGTVWNLRRQRMNMVQSETQYEFLYKCIHYAITNMRGQRSSSTQFQQVYPK